MKCNVGKTEQVIRIVIGLVIIFLGLLYRNWWGLIGLFPLATGALGYCPASDALGISTCKTNDK